MVLRHYYSSGFTFAVLISCITTVTQAQAIDYVKQFKEYLTTPQASRFVVRQIQAGNAASHVRQKEQEESLLVYGVWDRNYMHISGVVAREETSLMATAPFVRQNGNLVAILLPPDKLLTFSGDIDGSIQGIFIANSLALKGAILRETMMGGIMHAPLGSVKWKGDRFAVEGLTLANEITRIEGELTRSSNRVGQIAVTYSGPKMSVSHTVKYEYSAGAAGFFPTHIGIWVAGTNCIRRMEIVEGAIGPEAVERAAPIVQYAEANNWQMRILSNNAVHIPLEGGGTRVEVELSPPVSITSRAFEMRRRIYASGLLLNFGFALFCIRHFVSKR